MPQAEATKTSKYAVYPAGQRGGRFHRDGPLEEGTYFVIRDTDSFGVAALYAYVASVQTLLELNRRREFLTDDEYRELEELEDHVSSLALEWQRRGKGRLPD